VNVDPGTKCACGCGRTATGLGLVPMRPCNSGRNTPFSTVERQLCDECRTYYGKRLVDRAEGRAGPQEVGS
jgi:hypothetical protein